MPGLHSCLEDSLKLLARYERDKIRTNVDIHTLVQELSITRQDIRDFSFPLTENWFTNMSQRASRQDENRSRVWKTRRLYPSHSRSRLVSRYLNKNVSQALQQQVGHVWVIQHYRWVIYESQDGLQIGHRWVLYSSSLSERRVAHRSQDICLFIYIYFFLRLLPNFGNLQLKINNNYCKWQWVEFR